MRRHGRLATLLVAGTALTSGTFIAGSGGLAGARPAAAEANTMASTTTCQLGNGVQHVIEVTFDNVHFNRDNPNVASDIEQMPALENFITSQGTLLSNNHTPLIAHTADDTITNYTGLYGDRQGLGVSNDYENYNPDGSVSSNSAFGYWTAAGPNGYPDQPYSASVPANNAPPQTPPAPWVPFTRSGCDTGAVSTSNMELENAVPDIANVFGANSPEAQQVNADSDSYKDQETNDYLGLAVHCAHGSQFCTSARAVKYGETKASKTAVSDQLPDEPGGYHGFQAVFGHKYLQPQLAQAANTTTPSGGLRTVGGHTYPVTDAQGNLVDLNGKEIDGQYAAGPGFPGFGPISAAQSLAYVADMQETGVPVTYAYISDAHEKKSGQTGCSNKGTAQGPGDPCYEQTLASYNQAFADFFQRLQDDGITAQNTLFVFSADEGDHFVGANVGRAVTPTCSTDTNGAYTCNYAGKIGEQEVDIHGLLAAQEGDTTSFYNEPQGNSVYITGNPSPTSQTTRQLERNFAAATADDQWDGGVPENITKWEADPTVEQLLHFTDANPYRTPSFTVFPRPDFYLTSGTSDGKGACTSTDANPAADCTFTSTGYAWDHGYYAPEINNTWLGLVGPGVANKGIDGSGAAEGPNSAGTANSDPQADTSITNPGTWADHTDIRPTIMALTGLKDDYVEDGRVLTEDLTITPGQTGSSGFQPLAVCYKQLDSSVGRFGTDVLTTDTKALATGSATSDTDYQNVSNQIASLGSSRDAVANTIKADLYGAEFDNRPIADANGELAQCNAILQQADQLAAQ